LLGAVLTRPRPAGTHLVPLDRPTGAALVVQIGQGLESGLLAEPPLGGLDELEDGDRPTLVPAPQRETESGRGLSFSVAGVDHQQRPVAALASRETVVGYDGGLSLRHQ